MSQSPYISRPQAELVLDNLSLALKNPGAYPGLFNVWGVGGVGKTTFLDKVKEVHPEAGVAIASIGRTEKVDTPIDLMQTLHKPIATKLDTCLNLGQHETAIPSYEKALDLKPDLHQAHYNKACLVVLCKLSRDSENEYTFQ